MPSMQLSRGKGIRCITGNEQYPHLRESSHARIIRSLQAVADRVEGIVVEVCCRTASAGCRCMVLLLLCPQQRCIWAELGPAGTRTGVSIDAERHRHVLH